MNSKLTKKELGAVPTPQLVVRHIVSLILKYQNCKKKEMFILDNSVGDGRFLIEYYHSYFKKVKNKSILKSLYLFGLDINPKAIESARSRMKEIKCQASLKVGNTLVGFLKPPSDYKRSWTEDDLNKSYAKHKKINNSTIINETCPFHWFREWPEFLLNNGFDIIIGNPPYGVSYSKTEKMLYRILYNANDPEIESYILFIERSVNLLCESGLLGVIVPSNIATNYRYASIRNFLLKRVKILNITSFNRQIFPNVHVESLILILQKCSDLPNRINNEIRFDLISYENSGEIQSTTKNIALQKDLNNTSYQMLIPKPENTIFKILEKIKYDSIALKNLVEISRGIELGYKSPRTSVIKNNPEFVPLIAGRSVRKFRLKKNYRYIRFEDDNKSIFKDKNLYLKPRKLFLRRIGHELICAYDNNQLFCVCDVYIILPKIIQSEKEIFYLEALLNSQLMLFYFKHSFTSIKKLFPKIPINYLKQLPVKLPENPEKIYRLVKCFHDLPWRNNNTNSETRKLIDKLNQEIFLVYSLTSDEQKTIKEIISDFSI